MDLYQIYLSVNTTTLGAKLTIFLNYVACPLIFYSTDKWIRSQHLY